MPGETDGVGEGPIPAAFIQPPIREELAELSPSVAVGGEETLQTKEMKPCKGGECIVILCNSTNGKTLKEMEVKPFMSSSNICPEAKCGAGGVIPPPPSPATYFPADPWIFNLKTTFPLFSFSMFPASV